MTKVPSGSYIASLSMFGNSRFAFQEPPADMGYKAEGLWWNVPQYPYQPIQHPFIMPSPEVSHAITLGQPLTFPFSGKTAKNKLMKSAMSERLSTFSPYDPMERGQPTEELIRLYETWAMGEIGAAFLAMIALAELCS